MILDKVDKKKKDEDLKYEIEQIKKLRNKDIAEIKLLKVELFKLQTIYKKYQDGGAAKYNAKYMNEIELPERFVKFIQNKKRAMEMDEDQGIQQYGVTEDQSTEAIHMVDQNGDSQEEPEEASAAGVINTQNLIEDMAFVKNQIQCELIRLKNVPLKSLAAANNALASK